MRVGYSVLFDTIHALLPEINFPLLENHKLLSRGANCEHVRAGASRELDVKPHLLILG